jgi:hypothetical protein
MFGRSPFRIPQFTHSLIGFTLMLRISTLLFGSCA